MRWYQVHKDANKEILILYKLFSWAPEDQLSQTMASQSFQTLAFLLVLCLAVESLNPVVLSKLSLLFLLFLSTEVIRDCRQM